MKGVKVQDNYRLFMVPGMAHCGGGEGTSTFDMLTSLEQWVENKKAPDQIIASRVEGGKTVSRWAESTTISFSVAPRSSPITLPALSIARKEINPEVC